MEERNEKLSGDLRLNIKRSEKLENFWYHYKWHTITAIFVIVVGTVLTLQLCTKENYDVHILYAGEKNISSSSLSGDGNSDYSNIVKALEAAVKSGETEENVNVNLQKLYILSESELAAELEKIKDPFEKASLESTVGENYDQLYNYVMFGEFYLLLLSEDIFDSYEKKLESSIFAPISGYTKEGVNYEYKGERGIYLSSLDIYSDPALSILPPDTVVCIRLPGVIGARDDGVAYAKSEEMLRSLLSYEK